MLENQLSQPPSTRNLLKNPSESTDKQIAATKNHATATTKSEKPTTSTNIHPMSAQVSKHILENKEGQQRSNGILLKLKEWKTNSSNIKST